jgi:excisionase family DNA binding protein
MYLTVKETAHLLSVTQASIYTAIKDGRLRSDRKFGRIVISDKDADAYKSTVGVKNGYVKRGAAEQAA